MAHILIMPRQGNTVESCIITNWKVAEGDAVTAEAGVCEVETDKASFEVPAGEAGTVLKILYAQGDDVPVLKPIAVIGAAGEDWRAVLGEAAPGEASAEKKPETAPAAQKEAADSGSRQTDLPAVPPESRENSGAAASPRARHLAEKEALPLGGLSGTGPGGRIIERDVKAALETRPALTASAKAAAPGTVPESGSGLGGRVTLGDLSSRPAPQGGTAAAVSGDGGFTDTPLKGVRKIIADRMFKSLAETAQFTLNASAPAAKLQEFRSRIKTPADNEPGFVGELRAQKITVNDLVLFAVSRILPRFPFMNAHKLGDSVRTFERVHLGVAVDTPRGLMVPVIRNANLLSLREISSEAKRLAGACQNSSAKPDEITGSTFTVTNLGSLGITGFTPVLNTPEVAILGVCGIELKPVALPEGESGGCCCGVRYEPHIGLSLTINHQVVDGAPAARFLKELCGAIAQLDLLMAAS